MKHEKIIGTLLIIASGIIYTLEKSFVDISNAIIRTGGVIAHPNGGMWRNILDEHTFNNPFAWVFLIVGLLLLVYAYTRKSKTDK